MAPTSTSTINLPLTNETVVEGPVKSVTATKTAHCCSSASLRNSRNGLTRESNPAAAHPLDPLDAKEWVIFYGKKELLLHNSDNFPFPL